MAEVITECECGQLEPLQLGCEACGAEIGEECRPTCIGQAAELDRQQEARESASADYLAEWKAAQSLPTLPEAQAAAWAAEQKRVSAWQAIARGAAPQ